jgi:hypothetical protein
MASLMISLATRSTSIARRVAAALVSYVAGQRLRQYDLIAVWVRQDRRLDDFGHILALDFHALAAQPLERLVQVVHREVDRGRSRAPFVMKYVDPGGWARAQVADDSTLRGRLLQ